MRAVYELNRHTEDSTRQAMNLARQAAARDPSFAQPYVLLASGEAQLNTLSAQDPHAGSARAQEYVAKALALDPGNSAAHAQKAIMAYTELWDWPQAEREFQTTLASGSHGSAENLYGWCLMTRGRFEESRRHLQLAAELDPLSLGPLLNQVEELAAERKYPEARTKVELVLQRAPLNPVALALGSSIAIWQQDCSAATAWSHKLVDTYPHSTMGLLTVLGAGVICGHPSEGTDSFAKLLRERQSGFTSPYSLAAAYAVGNHPGEALYYLELSAKLREPVLLMLKVDRAFDKIRTDPALISLERRIGLLE
jgi:Tfp pilus assembly protein PilF